MTKEELMQFLKDNLRVDVYVIRPLYDGGGPYVRVTLYLGNDETEEYYLEENCEGLMFNIAYIINEMRDRNIEAKYWVLDGGEYSVSEILKMFK